MSKFATMDSPPSLLSIQFSKYLHQDILTGILVVDLERPGQFHQLTLIT